MSYLRDLNPFTSTTLSKISPSIKLKACSLKRPFAVCVIGASAGIGEHIAYAYATAGPSHMVIAARRTHDLDIVANKIRQINGEIVVVTAACDISSANSVADLADHIQAGCDGRLDVLISNPAYAGPVTLKVTEGQPAWFQQNFDVNVIGTYHAAHYLIPLLLATQGGAKAFIAVGSMAGCIMTGHIANTGYCLSKFTQMRLIEYLDLQFGKDGLLALAVHPGAVATESAVGNTPDSFLPYLVDEVGLCGACCVWLTQHLDQLSWLSGRFVSANWDVDELVGKKEEILDRDLLKWFMPT